MKHKIRKWTAYSLILLTANTMLWLICAMLSRNQIDDKTISFLNTWIIICYFCMIMLTRKVCGKLTFMSVWIALTIPFYFGQILFHRYYERIGYLHNIRSIYNGIFSGKTILTTAFFILECLIMICVVFCEAYTRRERITLNSENRFEYDKIEGERDLRFMRIVSGAVFYLTILPALYYWSYAAAVYRALGYVGMKSITRTVAKTSLIGISAYVTGWFLPSAYMLLISSKTRFGQLIVKLSLALVAFMIFRAGSRYKVVEILVAYLLIDVYWLNKGKKLNIKKYAILLGAVFAVSVLIRFERTGVNYSGDKGDIIGAVLGDTGSTIMINCAAIEFIPKKLNYGYGISFVNGVLAVLPSAVRLELFPNHQLDITGTVLTQMCGVTWSNFGSSFIAEGYYNFGFFSLLLMMLYGIVMGEVVNIQKNRIGSLSPCKFVAYIYFCSEFVFAIRSEFSSSIRGIILYILLPLAVVKKMSSAKRQ